MPYRPFACAALLLPLLACGTPPAKAAAPTGQDAPDDGERSGIPGPIRSGTISPGTASTPPSIAFAPVDPDAFPLADRLAFGLRAEFQGRTLFVHSRFRGARSSKDFDGLGARTLTISHHGVATTYTLYDGTQLQGGNVERATPVPFTLPPGQVMIDDFAFQVDLRRSVAPGDRVTVLIPQVSGPPGEAVVHAE
jgi:hypothetical protein